MSKGSLRAELKELGERENWSHPVSPLSSVSEFPPPPFKLLTQMKGGQTLSHMLIPECLVHIIGLSPVCRNPQVCVGGIQMLRELIAKSNLEIVGAVARIGQSNLSGPYLWSGP